MSLDMLGQVVQKLVRVPTGMLGPVLDLLEKLTGPSAPFWWSAFARFLRRENPWGKTVIFEVTTDGRTVTQHEDTLKMRGVHIDHSALRMLKTSAFVATSGMTYRLVVIAGDEFDPHTCTNQRARDEAARRGYYEPPLEMALYIQEIISAEELARMGRLALLIMHQPIPNKDEIPELLGCGPRSLSTYDGRCDARWSTKMGLVFLEQLPTSSAPAPQIFA